MALIEDVLMAKPKSINQEGTPPPFTASTEPPKGVGYGHPEFHFIESLMELNRNIGKMDTDQKVAMACLEEQLKSVKESTESTKKKVEDLVRWRFMILGGAVALGAVCTAMFGLFTKFGDRVSLQSNASPSVVMPLQTTPAPALQPAAPK